MAIDKRQLAALSATKLRGLLTGHLGEEPAPPDAIGSGAAMVVSGTAWVYQPSSSDLGPALLWAAAQDADRVAAVVDTPSESTRYEIRGLDIEVFQAVERSLVPVDADPVPSPEVPPDNHPLRSVFEAEGLDLVPGPGIWLGEILGLEVARLTHGDHGLQVGVGAFDRGAFEALYPDQSPIDALSRVVAEVRSHRHRGAPPHLMNRLVRERWLRADFCAEPSMLGLQSLAAVSGIEPRAGLHEWAPDAAVGQSGNERVLVVTSVGSSPGALPFGAALAERENVDRIVVAVPECDRHRAFVRAAQYLRRPVDVVGVASPWAASTT